MLLSIGFYDMIYISRAEVQILKSMRKRSGTALSIREEP